MDRVTRLLPFEDSKGRFSFRTMFSYIFDYAIIVALAIAYAALDKIVTPFSQPFSLNDIRLQYPYAVNERIPIAEAVAISGGFPIVAISIYTLIVDGLFSHSGQKGFKKYTFKQRLWELNCGILGLLLAQGAAFCVTGTLKNLIGRPRPDLLSRCILDEKVEIALHTLATKELVCTQQDAAIMQDAFRSFPSGHSSSSFAGLGYLSLYLAGKLHIFDQRGEVWRTVIVIIPLLAASCIAASRIMDARHHPTDVLIGSALGIACAWGAYRQYFPSLADTSKKGRAFPMREWGVSLGHNNRRGPDRSNTDDDGDGYYATGYSSANSRGGPAVRLTQASDSPQQPLYSKYPTTTVTDEESQMYRMEPLPPRVSSSNPHAHPTGMRNDIAPIPPRHGDIATGTHSGFMQSSPSEDTDYEMIRPKTAQSASRHSAGSRVESPVGNAGPNVFRDQIHKNQYSRGPGVGGSGAQKRQGTQSDDDDALGMGDDLGDRHRSPLIGIGK